MKNYVLAAVLASVAAPAAAVTVSSDFDVQSSANSVSGGVGLATGIVFSTGDVFSVSADLNDTWSLGATTARTGNADGLLSFGNFSLGGLSTRYGTLVGQIGVGGSYFALGTSYSGAASASGELFLYNWDSNAGDNTGSILASVSYDDGTLPAVPLPASGLLLAGALGGLSLRRKRR